MKRRDLLKTMGLSAALAGSTAELCAQDAARVSGSALRHKRSGPPIEQDGMRFWLETSLNRVFPNSPASSAEPLELLCARNGQFSFQACARNLRNCMVRIHAGVEGAGDWPVQIRRVGLVPMAGLDTDVPTEELDGLGMVPGLVPDPLYPEQKVNIGPHANASFWVTVRIPEQAVAGVRSLTINMTIENQFCFPAWTDPKPQTVALTARLNVRPLLIKARVDFPVTHWLSADSIWEYYHIEPFCECFWELADAYIGDLTAHGVNVIYSPIFNARHEILERPAQLLKVRAVEADRYEFDFSDVRRWIRLALKNCADHLEWTHFFTPAPTSGKHPQRIFERGDKIGKMLWPPEISANSPTYRQFLTQFLPAFKQVLTEERVLEKSLFHCADEPDGPAQIADYRKARALLKELAPWMQVMDAMSDPHFATERLSDMPVPSIVTAPQFAAADCPAWTYFCCGPRGGYVQRFLDTPLPKLRMAGWLFYKLKAKGFLHWGHNYWFVFCTGTIGNPFQDAAVGAWPGMPYGDAFVVYPGENGPISSIRWEVFAESLQDYAMLQSAGVKPDAEWLAALKTYEDFPKTEAWIDAAAARVMSLAT